MNLDNEKMIAKLFGKYSAGYISDENTNQLFPDKDFIKNKEFNRYIIEGVGVWILGNISYIGSQLAGALIVNIHGQELILDIKANNYNHNGKQLGVCAINVSAPGALPRAMLFNAADGSSLGWHHTTI